MMQWIWVPKSKSLFSRRSTCLLPTFRNPFETSSLLNKEILPPNLAHNMRGMQNPPPEHHEVNDLRHSFSTTTSQKQPPVTNQSPPQQHQPQITSHHKSIPNSPYPSTSHKPQTKSPTVHHISTNHKPSTAFNSPITSPTTNHKVPQSRVL